MRPYLNPVGWVRRSCKSWWFFLRRWVRVNLRFHPGERSGWPGWQRCARRRLWRARFQQAGGISLRVGADVNAVGWMMGCVSRHRKRDPGYLLGVCLDWSVSMTVVAFPSMMNFPVFSILMYFPGLSDWINWWGPTWILGLLPRRIMSPVFAS